jgi:hypothetical protein
MNVRFFGHVVIAGVEVIESKKHGNFLTDKN